MNFGDSTSFGNSFNYPAARPRHELNLIRNRSIPPEYTFTRNSAGTYIGPDGLIKTANVNQPRFDYDPITKEFKGLLIEESSTNLIPNSSTFTDSGFWQGNIGITISSNQSLAPDGATFNATLIQQDTSTSLHQLSKGTFGQQLTTTTSKYTISVFVKKFNANRITLTESYWYTLGGYTKAGMVWDFSTESIVRTFQWGDSSQSRIEGTSITKYQNGWYRISLTVIPGSDSNNQHVFPALVIGDSGDPGAGGRANFAGNGSDGVYIWGFQVEIKSFPTSYIPTSGSTVTRLPDQLILNKSLSTSGTFFVEARPTTGTTLVADNGTNAYYISPTPNTTTKNALYYNTNRVLTMSSSNTSTLGQSTNYQSTSGLNRVSLGFDRLNNTNYINGHIKNFKYYDSPVTEDNLRSLTGSNKNISRVADGLIVTSGLVLNLDAGNQSSYPGSGTTWTDLSGNGNNGTLVNGPTYSSANGGSLSFDGTNDYISIPSSTLFNIGSNDFCFESWIYLTGYSVAYNSIYYAGQIINRDTQTTRSFTFSITGTASSWTTLNTTLFTSNSTLIGTSASFNFSLNTWYHLVGSRIAGTVRLYVNGVDVGGGSNSTVIQNSTEAVQIGAESPSYASVGFGYYFPGRIPSVRIYNGKALSATEVQQNFNALRGRFGI